MNQRGIGIKQVEVLYFFAFMHDSFDKKNFHKKTSLKNLKKMLGKSQPQMSERQFSKTQSSLKVTKLSKH